MSDYKKIRQIDFEAYKNRLLRHAELLEAIEEHPAWGATVASEPLYGVTLDEYKDSLAETTRSIAEFIERVTLSNNKLAELLASLGGTGPKAPEPPKRLN